MTRGILDLYGVKDIRLLPEAMMSAIMNEDEAERHATLLAFLELHRGNDGRIDLSRDIMASMYESELAQRRENKQDFTPPMVSLLASRLTMANGTMGSVHEPTAGNGGMLIAYWHETLMQSPSMAEYKPSRYPVEAWELSDRSLPILLTNLALRGIVGVVIHGDVLELRAEAIYLLENPADDPLSFSRVRKITRENFAEFAHEQRLLQDKLKTQAQEQAQTNQGATTAPQPTKRQSGEIPEYTIEYLDLWNSKEQHSEK